MISQNMWLKIDGCGQKFIKFLIKALIKKGLKKHKLVL